AGFYDVIGEVAYVVDLLASTLAQCEIRPIGLNPENGPDAWEETADERVLRVWDDFVLPRGGKAELMETAATHLQIMGETYLVGLPAFDDFGRESGIAWEFLSPEALKFEGSGHRQRAKRYYGYAGMPPRELPEKAYIARLHKPDP